MQCNALRSWKNGRAKVKIRTLEVSYFMRFTTEQWKGRSTDENMSLFFFSFKWFMGHINQHFKVSYCSVKRKIMYEIKSSKFAKTIAVLFKFVCGKWKWSVPLHHLGHGLWNYYFFSIFHFNIVLLSTVKTRLIKKTLSKVRFNIFYVDLMILSNFYYWDKCAISSN